MTYIALVPDKPMFDGEHITLVWMGNANAGEKAKAEKVAALLEGCNFYGCDTNPEAIEVAQIRLDQVIC